MKDEFNNFFNLITYFKVLIFTFLLSSLALAQSTSDMLKKNEGSGLIAASSIKSKSVIEYRFSNDDDDVLADSGYKSFYYSYDKSGKLISYTKYHIFSALTIKEVYQYSGDKIVKTLRYNSADEMIETDDYQFNKSGKLKKEIYTAFYNSVRPNVHFTILANINDDELFAKLQEDLQIEPKIESYSITVNISDPDELNQYVVIGDESDPTSPRYLWSQLSMESQRGLLAFTGPNRKDYDFKSKNISEVKYKYDKKVNLIRKTVYNTAGDLIGKDTYTYNGDNKIISHYRYNENGRISSMETFAYDNSGRLSESAGLDASGKINSRLKYKYDSSGSLTEKIWYGFTGEVNTVFKFNYDTGGKLIKEIKFSDENETEGSTTYTYNENGNITDVLNFGADGKKIKLTKYMYDYY